MLTSELTDSLLDFFRVAKEKRVSRPSDTRVTLGRASLAAISCIVASAASHDGNR